MLPLEALEPGVARCEPRVLFLDLLGFVPHSQGFAPLLLDLFIFLRNSLFERVLLPHSFVDRWMPTY